MTTQQAYDTIELHFYHIISEPFNSVKYFATNQKRGKGAIVTILREFAHAYNTCKYLEMELEDLQWAASKKISAIFTPFS